MVKIEEQKHGSAGTVHLQIPGKHLQGRKITPLVQRLYERHLKLEENFRHLSSGPVIVSELGGNSDEGLFGEIKPIGLSGLLAVPLSNEMQKASSTVSEQQALVGLKAVNRICEQWGLSIEESANLVDMSLSTWKRARKPNFSGKLSKDQVLRLSAIVGIYKSLNLYFDDKIAHSWIKLPNVGPLCRGARPIDVLIEGGLPALLRVRQYLDALRGGS